MLESNSSSVCSEPAFPLTFQFEHTPITDGSHRQLRFFAVLAQTFRSICFRRCRRGR